VGWTSGRRAAVALSAALVLVGLAAYRWGLGRTDSPGPLDPSRQTVVFLGDSIAAGDGVSPDVTFAQRLGVALGVPVRNAGISGDTTAGGLRRLETDVLAYRPRLVVVELGLNDAVDHHWPAEATFGNLRKIVRRLRKDGAGVVLIHIRFAEFGSETYQRGFRRIAQRERAWLVEDFYAGVFPHLTPDGVHPNEEGHARLAARLEPMLRQILAR